MKIGSLSYREVAGEGRVHMTPAWLSLHPVIRSDIITDLIAELKELDREACREYYKSWVSRDA